VETIGAVSGETDNYNNYPKGNLKK